MASTLGFLVEEDPEPKNEDPYQGCRGPYFVAGE
jgi:hypothetical protein